MNKTRIIGLAALTLYASLCICEAGKIRGELVVNGEPAANIKVGLANPQGQEFDPTYTDKDGFYYFDGTKLSEHYTLRIWTSKTKWFESPILIQGEFTDVPPIAISLSENRRDDTRKSSEQSSLSKEAAEDFVKSTIMYLEKQDIDSIARAYADTIDYYEDGKKSREDVLSEKRRIRSSMSVIHFENVRIKCFDGTNQDLKSIRLEFDYFEQYKKGKHLNGHSEQVWMLRSKDGHFEIVSCQEKIHRKDTSGPKANNNAGRKSR